MEYLFEDSKIQQANPPGKLGTSKDPKRLKEVSQHNVMERSLWTRTGQDCCERHEVNKPVAVVLISWRFGNPLNLRLISQYKVGDWFIFQYASLFFSILFDLAIVSCHTYMNMLPDVNINRTCLGRIPPTHVIHGRKRTTSSPSPMTRGVPWRSGKSAVFCKTDKCWDFRVRFFFSSIGGILVHFVITWHQ